MWTHLSALTLAAAVLVIAASCSNGYTPGGPGGPGGPLPASLIGIGVGPQHPTVTLGESLQFTATGFYDDQTTRGITDSVEWSSSNPSVLQVSNSLDTEGSATTSNTGQSQVSAEYDGLLSPSVRVSVIQASIDELELSPSSVSLHQGERVQLQAQASFSDGSHGNVSGSLVWITDNPSVATVNASGEVKAEGVGSAQISGLYQADLKEYSSSPTVVTVVDGDVVIDDADLRIIGLSASSSGDTVSYSVQIKNSGGTPASAFWVDAWLNRTAAPANPPTSGDAQQMIDLLAPGDTQSVTIELGGVSPGNYQSWIMIDSFDSSFEGNLGENNNLWGPAPVSVSGGSGPIGPDLSITYLQAFVQGAQGQVLYIIDVSNTGDETADAFSVGVYSNPSFPPVAPATADEELSVPSLGPSETAYLSVIVRDVPVDYWQSYVLADRAASVDEPNENNNLATFQVVP